jgi:Xaa-Pro aminopeptidase
VEKIIAASTPGATFADLKRVALDALPPDQHEYMQVGSYFGHHIGLNSGDPSLLEQPLEPGMVFTVEPWYYNHDRQLAVFLEENIVVTDSKAIIISDGLPRDAAGLESLMRG